MVKLEERSVTDGIGISMVFESKFF